MAILANGKIYSKVKKKLAQRIVLKYNLTSMIEHQPIRKLKILSGMAIAALAIACSSDKEAQHLNINAGGDVSIEHSNLVDINSETRPNRNCYNPFDPKEGWLRADYARDCKALFERPSGQELLNRVLQQIPENR